MMGQLLFAIIVIGGIIFFFAYRKIKKTNDQIRFANLDTVVPVRENYTNWTCLACNHQDYIGHAATIDHRCKSCDFSYGTTYTGTLKDRLDLIRDLNNAISYFDRANELITGDKTLNKHQFDYQSDMISGLKILQYNFVRPTPIELALKELNEMELAREFEVVTLSSDVISDDLLWFYIEILNKIRTVVSNDIVSRLGHASPQREEAAIGSTRIDETDALSSVSLKDKPANDEVVPAPFVPSLPDPSWPDKTSSSEIPTNQPHLSSESPSGSKTPTTEHDTFIEANTLSEILFGNAPFSNDPNTIFANFKGKHVAWHGILEYVQRIQYDFVLGEEPAIRAEIKIGEIETQMGLSSKVQAVVKFSLDSEKKLLAMQNESIHFSGILLQANAGIREIYLNEGKLISSSSTSEF